MKFLLITLFLTPTLSNHIFRAKRDSRTPESLDTVPFYSNLVRWDRDGEQWYPVCTAAVLSANMLASSFSCADRAYKKEAKIRAGSEELTTDDNSKDLYDIKEIISHPNFTKSKDVDLNDICIIELKNSMTLDEKKIWPIALPDSKAAVKAGETFKTIFFLGDELYSEISEVIDQNKCVQQYPSLKASANHSQSEFCAYPQQCQVAVNGGPAVKDNKLVGIISTAPCGMDDRAIVYSDIHIYAKWIDETLKRNEGKKLISGQSSKN